MTDAVGTDLSGVEHNSSSFVPERLGEIQLAERTAALHTAITEGMWTGFCAGCRDAFNHTKPWPCPAALWAAGALADPDGDPEGDLEPANA